MEWLLRSKTGARRLRGQASAHNAHRNTKDDGPALRHIGTQSADRALTSEEDDELAKKKKKGLKLLHKDRKLALRRKLLEHRKGGGGGGKFRRVYLHKYIV